MSVTRRIARIALFVGIISALSQISIPMPSGVPITLQITAVALTGMVLGWKDGMISVLIYLVMGLIGLPVMAGFTGGLGKAVGLSGGFLWGFPLLAIGCGIGSGKNALLSTASALLGLVLCYASGILQYALVGEVTILAAIVTFSGYFVKDVAMVVGTILVLGGVKHVAYFRAKTKVVDEKL